jgi:cytochrome c553
MTRIGVLGLLAIATTAVLVGQAPPPNPVPWAYGFVTPGPEPPPPPCPADAKPYTCSRPGKPWVDDGILLKLAGSRQTFTIGQIQAHYDPADWYPDEHPQPVPPIVQYGRERDRLRACAHCHYHNGQGKPENGHLAGLPVRYFLQQLALFRSGGRTSADPRKANHAEMTQIARFLSDAEMKAAAEYYAAIAWKPWVTVIEKGKALVATGAGRTMACAACHGAALQGMADVPPIADRSVSYTVRQLYNYQQGTRQSQLMRPVVAKLSPAEMIAIAAYLASL